MNTFIFRYAAVGEGIELLAPPSFVRRSSMWAERYPLEGASRETFEILSPGVFPGADAKRLYDQARHSLLNATPLKEPYGGQTPEALWGRDGAKVYYGARQVPGVDGTRDLEIFLDAEGSFHVFNAGKRVVLYRPTELLGFVAREYAAGEAEPRSASGTAPGAEPGAAGPLPARKDMMRIFPGMAPPLRFWGNVPDTPYMTDGEQLYYLAGREASPENPRIPVPLGADPATAEIIWHGLLRDGNTIWQRGEKTAYDGASFRWWSNWHSADANGVYYNGVKLVIRGGRNGEEAYAPRLEEFDMTGEWALGDSSFARTRDAIFYEDRQIPVDAATFTYIGQGYFRDATQVFYGKTPLAGADPATFRLLPDTPYWATDGKTVYAFGEPVSKDAQ